MPFPDISSELLGIELVEHQQEVAAITEPNKHAKVELQARRVTENASLGILIPN